MASTKKGKKARVKKSKGGCSTKGGKLYIVKTPGRLTATKSKAKANKLVRNCRKTNKAAQACTWTTTTGAKNARRARRRGKK